MLVGARRARALAPRFRALSRALSSPAALVEVSYEGRVAVVTLNDPARLNALTEALGDALGAALRGLDGARAGAVVVAGAGGSFSAGGDLAFLRARAAAEPTANVATMRAFYARFLGPLRGCALPVVAAVEGAAVGAGAALATACDARVVARGARVGFTFAHLGIHCGMGSSYFLPRAVGPEAAARLLLTGDIASGEEMAALGWGALPPSDAPGAARAAAVALAARMAAGAPRAVRGMARTLRVAADAGLSAALEREALEQALCYAGADFREGVEAVAAKRRGVWTQF